MDNEEIEHITFVQQWIESGADLFRTVKPATPDPHLVSYFLLLDQDCGQVLLVEHKKAKLWLPAGGHVEVDEHPKRTVEREIVEELGVQADFIFGNPFFLTVTQAKGHRGNHTDVSPWYILKASSGTSFNYDEREFHGIRWFPIDEIPFHDSDPHMSRLVQKLVLHKIIRKDPSVTR